MKDIVTLPHRDGRSRVVMLCERIGRLCERMCGLWNGEC